MRAQLLAVLCVLPFGGCSTLQVGPTGFKMVNTNMKIVRWTPTEFTAADINTSTPLNSTWRGINRETNILGSTAVGLFIPGSGVAPAVVRGATVTVPHLVNPATTTP